MSEQRTPEEKLFAGQVLLYVPHDLRRAAPYEVTVTKVGRKWAEISGRNRIDVKTLALDARGYSSPGRCWRSLAEYEADKALQEAWRELRQLMDKQWYVPDGVGLNQIKNAKRALFKESGNGQ